MDDAYKKSRLLKEAWLDTEKNLDAKEINEISQFKRNELAWEYDQEQKLNRRRGIRRVPTQKQIDFGKSLGIVNAASYTQDELRWHIDQKKAERNKPSEKQIAFAKSLGIENPESMDKRRLSMAIDAAKGIREEGDLTEETNLLQQALNDDDRGLELPEEISVDELSNKIKTIGEFIGGKLVTELLDGIAEGSHEEPLAKIESLYAWVENL